MDGPRSRLSTLPLYYGWIIALLCFTAFLAVYSINFSFGVFFDFIIRDLDTSRATASIVFSVQTVSLYASSALVGNVVDRYGTRRLVAVGAALLGSGMIGASQANSFETLVLTYGLVAGTGMGIIYVIAFTLPSRWFQRRRGIATAIGSSGIGAATLLAPPAAGAAIAVLGWQETYLVLTAAALGGLILVATFAGRDPWTMGIDADHEFPAGDPTAGESEGGTDDDVSIRSVLNSRSFWLIVGSWIVIYLPFFTLMVHLVTYATDVGMTRWVGVVGLSLFGGMSVPGRLIFGAVGDRTGRPTMFVTLSLVLAVLTLLIPFAATPLVLLAITALFGLTQGGIGALVSPLIADFYGSEYVTVLYGVAALAFSVAALAGPYLAGLSVEVLGSYTPFFLAAGLFVFAGAGGIYLASMLEGVDAGVGIPRR
jgi:MFS family permease